MPENENPCAEHAQSDAGAYAVFAGAAVIQMLDGDIEGAEEWLKRIPRSKRGEVNIALEDVQMKLGRLGRG